ncbi:hypothetical protein ZWY2020_022486 [Hordeum vulgare]|nr:hypothetical protein ZWY2020_022486 [Hordeum vulgare]
MVQRRRVLSVVVNDGVHGYLLFKINVNHLFSSSQSQETKMRCLPAPITRFATIADRPERIDFALAGGGATLVGVSNQPVALSSSRSAVAGSASSSAAAGPPAWTSRSAKPWSPEPGAGSPPDLVHSSRDNPACTVTACFAAGTRLWVSATDRGTYSVDTTHGWRKEGDWELPFQCRGFLVPDLGAGLCFGLCPRTTRLCAWDVRRSPPPARYAWDDTRPCWPTSFSQENVRAVARFPDSSLAYLGDGEFCIAWTIGISEENSSIRQRALWLMGVKIGKNSPSAPLRLLHHKSCIYELPDRALMANALHVD